MELVVSLTTTVKILDVLEKLIQMIVNKQCVEDIGNGQIKNEGNKDIYRCRHWTTGTLYG